VSRERHIHKQCRPCWRQSPRYSERGQSQFVWVALFLRSNLYFELNSNDSKKREDPKLVYCCPESTHRPKSTIITHHRLIECHRQSSGRQPRQSDRATTTLGEAFVTSQKSLRVREIKIDHLNPTASAKKTQIRNNNTQQFEQCAMCNSFKESKNEARQSREVYKSVRRSLKEKICWSARKKELTNCSITLLSHSAVCGVDATLNPTMCLLCIAGRELIYCSQPAKKVVWVWGWEFVFLLGGHYVSRRVHRHRNRPTTFVGSELVPNCAPFTLAWNTYNRLMRKCRMQPPPSSSLLTLGDTTQRAVSNAISTLSCIVNLIS